MPSSVLMQKSLNMLINSAARRENREHNHLSIQFAAYITKYIKNCLELENT